MKQLFLFLATAVLLMTSSVQVFADDVGVASSVDVAISQEPVSADPLSTETSLAYTENWLEDDYCPVMSVPTYQCSDDELNDPENNPGTQEYNDAVSHAMAIAGPNRPSIGKYLEHIVPGSGGMPGSPPAGTYIAVKASCTAYVISIGKTTNDQEYFTCFAALSGVARNSEPGVDIIKTIVCREIELELTALRAAMANATTGYCTIKQRLELLTLTVGKLGCTASGTGSGGLGSLGK